MQCQKQGEVSFFLLLSYHVIVMVITCVVVIMPPSFSMGGGHIVSPLSVGTSVQSVRPVHNTIGFRAISFERIGVLDYTHRYIIIKCRSNLI